MDRDDDMYRVPQAWRLRLTDQIAAYMAARCRQEVAGGPPACPHISIPFPLVCEADNILRVILEAYQCPITIGDVKPGTGSRCNEAKRTERYDRPAVILDGTGRICAWYLPGAVGRANQARIWDSMEYLRGPLESSVKSKGKANWRTEKCYFRANAALTGAINLSPAWFQQGRGPSNSNPEVSSLLKSKNGGIRTREWVYGMIGMNALLSATLRVIHPQMYYAGRDALIRLGIQAESRGDEDVMSILPHWSSVYSAMSIMVNRSTPYHTDVNGRSAWLDMLLTVGNYRPLDIIIPTLSLRLLYNPGTIVALSGSDLQHGVPPADGDRACLAYYMRANVHGSAGVPLCHPPHIDDLKLHVLR